MKKRRIHKGFAAAATTPLPSDDGSAGTPDRAPGAQPRNGNAVKHGHYSLARRLKNAGLKRSDGRSALERLKADWKADVRLSRGGELSPQQEALLEAASNTWLMLSSVDAWLLDQESLVNRRRRELLPVVQQRAALVRTLRELLGDIGLERTPARRPLLDAVFASYRRGAGPQDEPDDDGEPEGPADG
jgi:hypothetical protein